MAGTVRPRDPDRYRRIARAAIDVVADRGVEGLTHRLVAARAGVPLGSTTYYFKSLDDLLAAAVAEAKSDSDARLSKWSDTLRSSSDLAAELTKLLVGMTRGKSRARTMVEHELYIAAIRRPALQKLSYEWDRSLFQVLIEFIDPVTAEVLAMTTDGLALQSMIRGRPLRSSEVEPLFRRAIG